MTYNQRNSFIRRAFRAGVPVSEIANRYGLSETQARDIGDGAVAQDRKYRERYPTRVERDAYWTGIYEGGKSVRQIARLTGHPRTTVRDAIDRYLQVLVDLDLELA